LRENEDRAARAFRASMRSPRHITTHRLSGPRCPVRGPFLADKTPGKIIDTNLCPKNARGGRAEILVPNFPYSGGSGQGGAARHGLRSMQHGLRRRQATVNAGARPHQENLQLHDIRWCFAVITVETDWAFKPSRGFFCCPVRQRAFKNPFAVVAAKSGFQARSDAASSRPSCGGVSFADARCLHTAPCRMGRLSVRFPRRRRNAQRMWGIALASRACLRPQSRQPLTGRDGHGDVPPNLLVRLVTGIRRGGLEKICFAVELQVAVPEDAPAQPAS